MLTHFLARLRGGHRHDWSVQRQQVNSQATHSMQVCRCGHVEITCRGKVSREFLDSVVTQLRDLQPREGG